MGSTVVVIAFAVVVVLLVLVAAVRVIKQYELGVLFRLRRVQGTRQPGASDDHPVRGRVASGVAAARHDADLVAGHITRDNVSVDVSAVAYFRVTDVVKSVVAIENVTAAIDKIAQTTLRKVVGQHI
jgi:regulator of protease activity HflC (stomatin/prohibitin superfamily)